MTTNAMLALTTVTLMLYVQTQKGHLNALANLAMLAMESIVPVNNLLRTCSLSQKRYCAKVPTNNNDCSVFYE